MIISVKLEHLTIKDRQHIIQLWDIDAAEIARVAHSQGQKGVRGLVSELIKKKMPTHLYNFEAVDWWFSDHSDASASRSV